MSESCTSVELHELVAAFASMLTRELGIDGDLTKLVSVALPVHVSNLFMAVHAA